MNDTKKGLGRGLEELGLGELLSQSTVEATLQEQSNQKIFQELPLNHIMPGQYQPRQQMDQKQLDTLAASIESQGVIQPITVRELSADQYEIIAGERRWRAAQQAGLTTIPAIIRTLSDQAALAIGILENVQREDLNIVDQALGLQRLIEEFGLTHEQCAHHLGQSRSHISNTLRLLQLEPSVLQALQQDQLSMGHARCLLALNPQRQKTLATQVISNGLSVRKTEALVQHILNKTAVQPKKQTKAHQADVETLEQCLSLPITIKSNAQGQGKLTIRFNNTKEYLALMAHLKKQHTA